MIQALSGLTSDSEWSSHHPQLLGCQPQLTGAKIYLFSLHAETACESEFTELPSFATDLSSVALGEDSANFAI